MISDEDHCLLSDKTVLHLSNPDAAGYLERRSNISGWYTYWFSLRGSQLLYFERVKSRRRGPLVGVISLFRCRIGGSGKGDDGNRVLVVTDAVGKAHQLKAGSGKELRWWASKFISARNIIPPARPIGGGVVVGSAGEAEEKDGGGVLSVKVDAHLKVDHVLFVVAGVGTDSSWLSSNTKCLEEGVREVMEQIYPDVDFRTEILSVEWRSALTSLDVHKKLAATAPKVEDANPLRDFMSSRVIDYIYYNHARYRRHILRSVAGKLNAAWSEFCERRPGFSGKVSVFSHSLGSVLMYDLLCKKVYDDQNLLEAEAMRLDFDVANLFIVGSPLGTFINLDPTLGPHLSDPSKLPFRILNVFHPNDPIATRCEPYGDIRMTDVKPISVPHWRTMGEHESTVQWLGSMWTGKKAVETVTSPAISPGTAPLLALGAQRAVESPSVWKTLSSDMNSENSKGSDKVVTTGELGPQSESASSIELNGGSDPVAKKKKTGYASAKRQRHIVGNRIRIDYGLQVLSAIEEVSTSWSALRAHTDYWSSRDLMLLVVNQMIESTLGEEEEEDDNFRNIELDALVVDHNITEKVERLEEQRLKRKSSELQARGANGVNGFHRGPHASGTMEKMSSTESDDDSLESVVERFVARVVEEAAGMYLLEKRYPRLASSTWGTGVGSEPTKAETESKRLSDTSSKRGSGTWIGNYLSWFGKGAADVKDTASETNGS